MLTNTETNGVMRSVVVPCLRFLPHFPPHHWVRRRNGSGSVWRQDEAGSGLKAQIKTSRLTRWKRGDFPRFQRTAELMNARIKQHQRQRVSSAWLRPPPAVLVSTAASSFSRCPLNVLDLPTEATSTHSCGPTASFSRSQLIALLGNILTTIRSRDLSGLSPVRCILGCFGL